MPFDGRKHKKPKSLSASRPKGITKPRGNQSSRATRTTIRTHHQLSKAHAQALKNGDSDEAEHIKTLIATNGGLEAYQAASITGQSAIRGGDSSEVLIDWLRDQLPESFGAAERSAEPSRWRALEVGALSTRNAMSRCGWFDVERIDLNSQAAGITEQDFMKRPLPADTRSALAYTQQFDLISLSLVLNYVPDAEQRGEMLVRVTRFLRRRPARQARQKDLLPALFLVLPAPCVTNSRYLNEERLSEIMGALGFQLKQRKLSSKLIYQLWLWHGDHEKSTEQFGKAQVNPGTTRNNFCIILKSTGS